MKKALKVLVDEELLRRFKAECAMRGTSLTRQVEELVRAFVGEPKGEVPVNIVVGDSE